MYIRLYDCCGTDLGRSIAEITDNIHAIGVVKTGLQVLNLPTYRNSRVIKTTHI